MVTHGDDGCLPYSVVRRIAEWPGSEVDALASLALVERLIVSGREVVPFADVVFLIAAARAARLVGQRPSWRSLGLWSSAVHDACRGHRSGILHLAPHRAGSAEILDPDAVIQRGDPLLSISLDQVAAHIRQAVGQDLMSPS